ncbi:MAG: phosphate/phosphite/phosphonate ABC transporter substrate-binding protein [Xenococcaceae cyanobacterium MO_188.B32]|nr:phosphate/phosphite/phosphonate ABC transporter substrate-binding protein [Xenococcaceae cyanobacterium MO_188.B32]
MLRNLLTTIAVLGILSPLGGCEQRPNANAEATGKVVVGDISLEAEYRQKRFEPIANYLADNLGKVGIGQGEVKIAPDKETMAQLMSSGEIDIYFDSLYPAMFVIDRSGGRAILRRWKDGVAEYHSLFIARYDGQITSLSDLGGKIIALDEPASTSGYMLPVAHLLKASMNPIEVKELNESVPANKVGYIFAGKDSNIVKWLIEGKVAAGVIDSESFKELSTEQRAQLLVLDRTAAFPRQIAVVRPGLESKKLKAIKNVLMEMDETKEGQTILKEFKNTVQFDEFPQGAKEELAKMRESYELVQKYNR